MHLLVRRPRLSAALTAATALCIALPGLAAQITDVRVGVHPKFTRIVFELDGRAGYQVERGGTDAAPELRITIEAMSSARELRSNGDVRGVKVDAGTKARAHIALRQSGLRVHEMMLADPPRIVIDLHKPETAVAETAKPAPKTRVAAKEAPAPAPAPKVAAKETPAPPAPAPAPKVAGKETPKPELAPKEVAKETPKPAPQVIAKETPKPAPPPQVAPTPRPAPEAPKTAVAPPAPPPAPKEVAPVPSAPPAGSALNPAPRVTPPPSETAQAAKPAVPPVPEAAKTAAAPPAPLPAPALTTPPAAVPPAPVAPTSDSVAKLPSAPVPTPPPAAQSPSPVRPTPTPAPTSPAAAPTASESWSARLTLWIGGIAAALLSLAAIVVVQRRRRALPNDLDVTAIAEEVERTSDAPGRIPSGGFAMGDDSPSPSEESTLSGLFERPAAPAPVWPAPPPSAKPTTTPTPTAAAEDSLFEDAGEMTGEPDAREGDAPMNQEMDLPVDRRTSPPAPRMGGSAAPSPDIARMLQDFERRIATLEARLDESNEAREKLERQVAAQSEELRVQRAAIARTQRALRTMTRSDEEKATEPALRDGDTQAKTRVTP